MLGRVLGSSNRAQAGARLLHCLAQTSSRSSLAASPVQASIAAVLRWDGLEISALKRQQDFMLGHHSIHSSAAIWKDYVSLNSIADHPGATKQRKRLGRGIGSGRGKTSGRGHKGQKARTGRQVKPNFEGGQTPIKQYTPKRGFHNPFTLDYTPLNLYKLKDAIKEGKLRADQLITMRDLRESGVIHKKMRDGVKLLGRGCFAFNYKVHLQVSQASEAARKAVEKAGGTVTTVYYNKLGLRALMMPEWFEAKGRKLPRPARPHPKKRDYWDTTGSLPPVPFVRPASSQEKVVQVQAQ